ncbi:TadG family pilus assembly protein [Paraburkholderia sp. BL18I3N2]|uniref:TadG family pilus assembly protein n=1 Tax=Paraburkholderia sp. BL18I3N2 TaxID=1938799 RepID=UPI000D04C7D2|nr:TadG family pilus assembly protein [Paraburkholderia sp. BL18I3N2]
MRRLSFAMSRAARRAHPLWMRRAGARRQHGAVAVVAVIWLSVAIAALGALDVGNVFFARRQLQRTADLAALAAVQMIGSAGGCATAATAAQQNAAANGFTAGATTTINTTCGRWDTSKSTYFGTSGNPLNAVQVTTTQVVPYFFVGPSRNVSATATAFASNIDAFSLGTGIASINTQQSALLNAILGGLLKTSVSLSVGDTQSLASAHIKLQDLMVALGASTMQGLLGTTVSFQQLMVAMVTALQAGGDTINASILQKVAVAIPGEQNITIGDGGATSPGLLALGLATPNAAATATVNAFDALLVAAQIAQRSPDGTQGNAPVINVATGLAGVAGISLKVIKPPVLAVGEGGTLPNGTYRTMGRTAVVNVSVNLLPLTFAPISLNLGIGSISISALSTPIMLSLTSAQGTAALSSVDCESTRAATNATILVQPSIATVCVGANSTCGGTINVAEVTVWTLLTGTNELTKIAINGTGQLPLAPPSSQPVTFNGASGSFDSSVTVNSNAVGSDASTLTAQLLKMLPNTLQVTALGLNLTDVIQPLLSALAPVLSAALQPVFALLDAVLVPTLALLGVQVGTATVHNMSLTCGVSQLVN